MPRKENIQQMFDSIAPGYDAFNHLTSLGADRRWRKTALREVTGPRVLDEACGTGDFAIAIAEHLARKAEIAGQAGNDGGGTGSAWSVTGVDISDGMLEVMRRKVIAAGLDGAVDAADGVSDKRQMAVRVSAETGDCCALGYPDASFDTVTVAFGVRNFENREKALAEVLRVLRPGGRFVMLELGIPSNPVVRAAYKLYFTRIMPLIGCGISKDKAAYRYLPASVLEFPKPEDWTATMQKAGFADVRHRPLSLGICNLFTGVRE